jgi:hypothetical protein
MIESAMNTQNAEARGRDSLPQASGPGGDGEGTVRSTMCRSKADDERVAIHEAAHATIGRLLGQPLGGVTIVPGDGFSGRCWGPKFESRFASEHDAAPLLCERIAPMMPQPGEARDDIAPIFLHCYNRAVELVAGSIGEDIFLAGPAWDASDDRKQERAFAALVASSREAAEAFIEFCRVEAAALLRAHQHVVGALTKELLARRTMTGEEIDEVIAQAIAEKTLADEHARRAAWKRAMESAASFDVATLDGASA